MKSLSAAKKTHHRTPNTSIRLLSLSIMACFASQAHAYGTDPVVVNGAATFSQAGNVQTVKNINGTIINWGTLSVLQGEVLNFDQAVGSSVLNRVVGVMINGQLVKSPTEILGTITSPGNVWIINTAGVMVGAGAVINVAQFVGSTIDVSNANFLAGKLLFDGESMPGATVRNQGAITTSSGGSVYLIGTDVKNEGIINTPQGETILAAGKTVSLIDTGTPGVKVEITGSEGNATNLGTILADAGRIGIAGVLVRNSGTLNASSVVNEGGRIFLKASQDAYVDGNGRIVTTGTKGGQVEVLGANVVVTDNATIDASGKTGGGSVLLGGDTHGSNAQILNADTTYFGKDATVRVDATDSGNGGKVVIWSNSFTKAYGQIYAQGGANGGNGGFVETSGHRLDVEGIRVSTLAPQGKTGTWLLDPGSICVYNSNSALCSGADLSTSWSTIDSGLATSEVAFETDGNSSDQITIAEGYSYNRSNRLHFYSRGSITAQNVTVQNSGTGAIDLVAGWNGSITGAPVTVSGTGTILIDGSTIKTNGSMSWKAGGSISIRGNSSNAAYVSAGGNQTLMADADYGVITVQGSATGTNKGATVESQSGTQTISANIINVYGGGTTGGGDYSGNSAQILANGTQLIQVTGTNGILRLEGGGNAGYGGFGNYALIRQSATGGLQQVSYTGSGGSLYVYGGNSTSSGYHNKAEIDGHYGDQTIGDAIYRPNIILRGGNSGGQLGSGNDATIGLDDRHGGTQTVYAGEIGIYGGTANFGGAGFGAPKQRFNLSGNLTMQGGSSQSVDEDGVPGGAVFIGSKYGADIQMTVGGDVLLKGGSGSPVIIGSLTGTATVAIQTATARSVTIYSDTYGQHGGVFIGSLAEFGSTSSLTGNDVMLGSNTSIVSGANVNIESYGGNVGLGYIEVAAGAGYGATINAHNAILDQNSTALNIKADDIHLASYYGGVSGGKAISVDTQAANRVYAQVSTSGGYDSYAAHQDDNGVPDTSAAFGGISIRNTGSQPSQSVALYDYAISGGDVSYTNQGNLALNSGETSNRVEFITKSGNLTVETTGNLTTGSGSFSPKVGAGSLVTLKAGGTATITNSFGITDLNNAAADLSISAGGNISVQNGATISAKNVEIVSTGGDVGLSAGGNVSANGNLTVKAGNVNIDSKSATSKLVAVNGDVKVTASGNVVLNDGSYISAGDDVYLTMSGKNSTLYLNDGLTQSQPASYILAGAPTTIHLDFTSQTSSGVVIDGVKTTTTQVGKSGFFNTSLSTPAVAGEGLKVSYATAATVANNSAATEIDRVLQTVTNKDNRLSSNTLSGAVFISQLPTNSSASTQTTGGESEDSFGGSEKKGTNSDGSSSSNNNKDQGNGKPVAKSYCN